MKTRFDDNNNIRLITKEESAILLIDTYIKEKGKYKRKTLTLQLDKDNIECLIRALVSYQKEQIKSFERNIQYLRNAFDYTNSKPVITFVKPE